MRTKILPILALSILGCGRSAIVSADALPLKRVVIYRNGVGYFERSGHVDRSNVQFKMREGEVGDFLATLAVMENGGSSVKAAAFPLADDTADQKPRDKMTADEKKGLKTVVLNLDGKEHDLQVGYVAESPVWKPSYRLVVKPNGEADLQAWGIVQNLSGEDWTNVSLSLVAGAPLAFQAQLGEAVIPTRPTVTDTGEVIAAVPRGDTSLQREMDNPRPKRPTRTKTSTGCRNNSKDKRGCASAAVEARATARWPQRHRRGDERPAASAVSRTSASTARSPPRRAICDRSRRSPMEGGTTRYDLPSLVTIPDKSATMVMLAVRKVPGEALFLFAPDGGVPDSTSHPFRVVRFSNRTGGALERGPIAVFEKGAFLGQGMVDPLPEGATATVPFALERALAVDQERKYDELGERIAKIENSELTIERDAVTQTKYRVRNGTDTPAKMLVRHARQNGTRLYQPPKDTEDNVGTQSALVPMHVDPRQTAELTVDERQTMRMAMDWFSVVADNAVKAYLADPRANEDVAAKLSGAWSFRDRDPRAARSAPEARARAARSRHADGRDAQKPPRDRENKTADALRAKLTARLGEMSTRIDDITKQLVETDSKLAEIGVRFKEAIREIKLTETPAAKP